jgi:hypothetical protein
MDDLARELAEAHSSGNGYQVAQILLPVSPPDNPGRLRTLWKSTNAASLKKDVSTALRRTSYLKSLPDDELTGWIDIVVAYWKALNEIVPATEPEERGKVNTFHVWAVGPGFFWRLVANGASRLRRRRESTRHGRNSRLWL